MQQETDVDGQKVVCRHDAPQRGWSSGMNGAGRRPISECELLGERTLDPHLAIPKRAMPPPYLSQYLHVFLAFLSVISRLPVPKKVDRPACNAIGDWTGTAPNPEARYISGSGCSHLYLVSEAFPRPERLSNVSGPERVLSLRPPLSGFLQCEVGCQ